MFVPCFAALIWGESALPLGVCAGLIVLAGVVLVRFGNIEGKMSIKEGYLVVAGAWVVACVLGAMPYLATGIIPGGIDAIFEAVAGFTTTGTSVLADRADVPNSILLWRSMSSWIGGAGIIMLFILLLPGMGISTVTLFNTESADFMPQRVLPKIKDKVSLIWKIYLGLTVLVVLALLAAGMTLFDAVNHAMTSISTAGFSASTHGIEGYDSIPGDCPHGRYDSGKSELCSLYGTASEKCSRILKEHRG
jgi:trk system potassium uptake protein TrkH